MISDLETLTSDLKNDGPVVLGHKRAVSYLEAVRRLTTLNIADGEIKDDFIKFLKVLHKHVAGIEDKLSSRNIIKDFLNSSLKLFDGVELTIHIIRVAAVKISIESVVESLVSRYEAHFDKSRQFTEEHALE